MESSQFSEVRDLPVSKQFAYGFGMLGWSILISIVNVMLIYLYLPPANSGMKEVIPQVTILFIFNILSLIAASGRLFDAITDPLIAHFSDRSKLKLGRRIPFMRLSIIPCTVFCALLFTPISREIANSNIVWLVLMQLGFYFFLTAFNVPYNALLPELGHNEKQKLELATFQSGFFVLGMVISSQTPLIAEYLEKIFHIENRRLTFQIAIWGMCAFAAICMAIPSFTISESRYCISKPSTLPLMKAMRQTLGNSNFRLFIVADFSYFTSITVIMSGLLYYVTVLLGLPEAFGPKIIMLMVGLSILFYPLVNVLANWKGKKIFVSLAFLMLSISFIIIYYLGKMPFSPETQGYLIGFLGAIPLAFLSILPTALLADISTLDGIETGHQKEGLYYAVKSFFQKLGQTIGIMIFAMLTLYGKDPGNDLGIRLTGVFGLILCLAAAIVFYKFDEEGLMRKTRALQKSNPESSDQSSGI